MKIRADQRGMIIANGELKKVVKPGFVITPPFQTLEIYSIYSEILSNSCPVETLIQNKDFLEQCVLVNLKDNEIALHFQGGVFKEVLRSGKHLFWKSFVDHTFTVLDLNNPVVDAKIDRVLFMRPELKEFVTSCVVEPTQKGMLFIDNAFVRMLDSGTYFFLKGSRSVSVTKAELRQQQIEITGQDILTRDKIPLRLNFFCQYRIVDCMKSHVQIIDYDKQFYIILQLAVREYAGTFTLDDILAKKEEIGSFIKDSISDKAEAFGLEVLSTGIKDIILPGEIKDILNQVLIAEKKSQANVIMRREETASTRSLLNTAKLLDENKTLYHLKELEYIERISERISQISLSSGSTHLLEEFKRLFIPGQK